MSDALKLNPGVKVEVLEHSDASGEIVVYEMLEADLPLTGFDQSPEYKQHCEHCPKYAKNLACPPFSPTFAPYVKDVQAAKVICIRLPLDYFRGHPVDDPYEAGHERAQELLTAELLKYREQGFRVLGSGPCRSCGECVVEKGKDECILPDKRIYSLESLGVNVVALTKAAFGFELDWNGTENASGYVSAVGAVFEGKTD
jgi:predicted metal-binding protein